MPIKLPFSRRKSSGTVLESIHNASEQSSFRVLDRNEVLERTYDGSDQLKRRSAAPPNSRTQSLDNVTKLSNRGSDRTTNSASTGEASSPARLSYVSTSPSSVDDDPQHDTSVHDRPCYVPLPRNSPGRETHRQEDETSRSQSQYQPKQSSMKSNGRKISFGSKQNKYSGIDKHSRDIPNTTSTYTGTVIPLQLNGSELGWDDSDFGSGGIGKKESTILKASSTATGPISQRSTYTLITNGPIQTDQPSTPLNLPERPHLMHPAYSFDNSDAEKLLSSSYPVSIHTNSHGKGGSSNDANAQTATDPVAADQLIDRQPTQPLINKQLVNGGRAHQGSSGSLFGIPVSPLSTSSFQALAPQVKNRTSPSSSQRSSNTTPRAPLVHEKDEPLFDITPKLKVGWHASMVKNTTNKVMTPAEYDYYKQQTGGYFDDNDTKSEASAESDTYEDEDETERNKQLAVQRRKQEAHLAVYRQQMMKVTGEQPPNLPAARPGLPRISSSAPNLLMESFSDSSLLRLGETNGKPNDDDDDVPLGILQAHGFPNKHRPPTRLSSNTLTVPRVANRFSYPAPPNSTRNEPSAGGGANGSLPVFARNLPVDPYIGASLVRPPNRESMPYNNAGPMKTSSAPGGLVGIIVGEERARALRRGSPNARGTYDFSQAQPPMQMMSPSEQAQLQVTTSMQQMMEMQMQFMQQMMQMQGMRISPSSPMPGQPSQPNQSPYLSLPGIPTRLNAAPRLPTSGLSTASSPSIFGVQGNYSPSLAPSERSNIGQPSRYRPVTPAGASSTNHDESRNSTLNQPTAQGLAAQRDHSEQLHNTPAKKSFDPSPMLSATIRAVDKPKGRHAGGASDDEDEEGWREMRRKREEKRGKWRASRLVEKSATIAGAQEVGLEGLFYQN